MPFDTYMWLSKEGDGCVPVEGETTDATFAAKKAFEIYSFSIGASNPVNMGSGGGGGGAGKVSLSSFNVMKKTDNASPGLFRTCCNGGHYAEGNVVLRKAGGEKGKTGSVYLCYNFKEVFVESIQWSGSTGGDDTPTESVSFAYGAVQIQYTPQKPTGGLGKMNEQQWNQIKNDDTFDVS